MSSIVFIDTEIEPNSHRILDIGGQKSDGATYHGTLTNEFIQFLEGTEFICGHNILSHDIKYIKMMVADAKLQFDNVIDTLHLSALLFPKQPYHALLKNDKLQTDELNNPLNDALKAKDLFYDEVSKFQEEEEIWKTILYGLLYNQGEFQAFFRFLKYKSSTANLKEAIQIEFDSQICRSVNLERIIRENPKELAYCLSLIRTNHRYSITPPWVLKNYPEVEVILYFLRNKPCLSGCSYCNRSLDVELGLKEFFGFNAFRTFGGEALQEKAARAAIEGKALLAVFPTGGGKSITFQVPALMSGKSVKGLTVVISPLQSLMKDQVDNLEKANVTNAVTINGLLDPIERAKSFERVENGSAAMLYISPESLRSKSIERLLLGRKVVRFVIDEAHCFSSWGQDFRVDYLYVGDFIQSLQKKKNLRDPIPVSCFTATAKQKVIEDIQAYFREKLALDLELFRSKTARTNLHYKVSEQKDEAEKYRSLRNLIDQKNCPTIVYVSRTKRAYGLSERLSSDGYEAKPYHGKMDKQEKSRNQDAFINGEVQIIVATSAFGMGVDKKDVGAVIHYEISDSLENYIQEAGRAGRDENMTADCYVLFNEEDLSKHFILLNQTKLSIKEIQQIWKAIKYITKFRATASQSALEIARRAGWDDNILQIETRVTTAIAALENAGYLKRGQNMPRIFANSILAKNAQEAIDKINGSKQFDEKQKIQGIRIIKKLLSSKSRKQNNEDVAESRVDYISDHLGIVKEEVINIITLLREERILADAKDLTAFIKVGEQKNKSLKTVELFGRIEQFLLSIFKEEEQTVHLKELNEQAETAGCTGVNPQRLKLIINFWAIKNWIKRQSETSTKDRLVVLSTQSKESLFEKLKTRQELARFIIELLFKRAIRVNPEEEKREKLVEFSVLELKEAYEQQMAMFKLEVSLADVEDALFYLSRIEAIKIEGGFLVVYNSLTIERLEENTKRNYKKEDYKQLNQFYENKVQQIHIVGEYAK